MKKLIMAGLLALSVASIATANVRKPKKVKANAQKEQCCDKSKQNPNCCDGGTCCR